MCGIAGFVGTFGGAQASDGALARMCGAIRHRGPDDEGHLVAPKVALGMRRLAIIDVARGQQPIGNEDGSVQIVFNGEIYNHRPIQARLERNGHRFRTHCDTEAIVHLYEERGDAVVNEIAGMFAFAIWDARKQRLLVARDRLGIKPLYYWATPTGLAFASELRSFLAMPEFPRTICADAVGHFLTVGYVPDPLCIFEGVKKLPPGHTLSWSERDGARVERYWTPARDEVAGITEQDAVVRLRELLRDAVASHLESEVPLGAFLSGGIDSSTVVALMAREMNQPVRTFSIGFDEPEYNEAPDAAAVAQALGTQHTELIVRPDVDEWVDHVIRCFDEPFADPSALPTFLVSQLARRHVTVALSGDGGDEIFGGYTRYAELLGRRELPSGMRAIVGGVARVLPFGAPGRNRALDLGRSLRGRYAATVGGPLPVREGGFAADAIARRTPSLDNYFDDAFAQGAGRDFLTQMSIVDLQTYLPGDILTKVDRTSMAVSLETRVPLLDHSLVEFAVSLPGSLKIRDGDTQTTKWIFRQAIGDLVPRRVLEKKKQGFGVPFDRWFRRELRHRIEALVEPNNRIYEWTDARAVKRIADEHHVGRRNHAFTLWRLLVLDRWLAALDEGALGRSSMRDDELAMAPSVRAARTTQRRVERGLAG